MNTYAQVTQTEWVEMQPDVQILNDLALNKNLSMSVTEKSATDYGR